jgi:hypothetical protein
MINWFLPEQLVSPGSLDAFGLAGSSPAALYGRDSRFVPEGFDKLFDRVVDGVEKLPQGTFVDASRLIRLRSLA